MQMMPSPLRRLRNLAVRTLRHLPSPSQAVSPWVADDLFEAHRALYRFASTYALGRSCLDLGCGTGYGSEALAAAGAAEVRGVDSSSKAIAVARKRFGNSKVTFTVGDLTTYSTTPAKFDLAVAINVFVHVPEAAAAIRFQAGNLTSDGMLIASLPPILDGQTLDRHRALPRHRSNLYLWDWEDAFKSAFAELRLFRQVPPEGRLPRLADSAPASLRAEEYRFEELALADLYDVGSLAAVYVASSPKAL